MNRLPLVLWLLLWLPCARIGQPKAVPTLLWILVTFAAWWAVARVLHKAEREP